MDTYIDDVTVYEPEELINIDVIAKIERFFGELDNLKNLGYRDVRVASGYTSVSLAEAAAKKCMQQNDISPDRISTVIYCHFWNDTDWNELHCFRLHKELGLTSSTNVFELKSSNQNSGLHALQLARKLLLDPTEKDILIVCSDKLDTRYVQRKMSNGIFGDGAAALRVSREKSDHSLSLSPLTAHAVSSKYYRLDQYTRDNEKNITAELDRISSDVLSGLLTQLGGVDGIRQVVTHNLNRRDIERGLAENGVDKSIIYQRGIADWGYVPTAGYFINLHGYLMSEDYQSNYQNSKDNGSVLVWGPALGVNCSACVLDPPGMMN